MRKRGKTSEPTQKLYSRRTLRVGKKELVIMHEVGSDRPSKLDPEMRGERRADNKAMQQSRKKHRKRKKHGRNV